MGFGNLFIIGGRCIRIKYLDIAIIVLLKQGMSIIHAPICKNCSAYQCENCFWINKKYTYEVSVSPSFQCKKAMIENKISYKLQKKIGRKIECYNQLDNDGFKDPYLKMDGAGTNLGYYTVM